ncbi:MAG TPA: hypothetical protein VJC18_00395, partial [bacterium]|nr:hypothetical protein [bacterium]
MTRLPGMATTIPLTSTITPTTNLTPLIDLSQTTTDVERFGDLYTPLARQVPLVPYRMTFKQAYYRHYLPVRLDERVMRSYQDMNPETRASLFPHHSTEWLPPQDCADEVVVAQRLVAIARLDPEHTQLLLFQGGLWLIAGPTTTANTLLDLMA